MQNCNRLSFVVVVAVFLFFLQYQVNVILAILRPKFLLCIVLQQKATVLVSNMLPAVINKSGVSRHAT